jgi:hypothetical protein
MAGINFNNILPAAIHMKKLWEAFTYITACVCIGKKLS